jgi:L-threonylcarbamoyladenylate synthase
VTTVVLEPTPENLARAVEALRRGFPVAMPTETVYGLAAPLDDVAALERVFEAKQRPKTDPLIVHAIASDLEELCAARVVSLDALSPGLLEAAERLVAVLWPGPLTLVLPRGERIHDLVTSGLGSVAVRSPRHPVARALLTELGAPLCAPSANRFGRVSPTSARAVVEELGGRVGIVLDGGPCEVGVESTVVRATRDRLEVLRPGGIALETIERLAHARVELVSPSSSPEAPQAAPGTLESHYAPAAPVIGVPAPTREMSDDALRAFVDAALASRAIAADRGASLGWLVCAGDVVAVERRVGVLLGRRIATRTLSPRGDDAEAARSLFAVLRAFDEDGVAAIFAEPVPVREGLWLAIADRLARASRTGACP